MLGLRAPAADPERAPLRFHKAGHALTWPPTARGADEASPRLGGMGQAVGNLLDIVERAIGNGDDQLVGLIVGQCQP